jgi:chemotaxis signal transduction protein
MMHGPATTWTPVAPWLPEPPARGAPDAVDILAIRVAGQPLALRMAQVGGVLVLSDHRRVVRVPAADPALLGVVAIRGVVMPIFSLSALLGLPGPRTHRWFTWVEGRNPVAYAFDAVDGRGWHGPESLRATEDVHPLLIGAALYAGTARPLLNLADGILACRAMDAERSGAHRAPVAA